MTTWFGATPTAPTIRRRCTTSSPTWARSKMGDRAAEFDADLMRVLSPWIVAGKVEFETQTELTWGRPRLTRPGEIGGG